MKNILIICLVILSKSLNAQNVLKLEDFMEQITKYHPIAKQAQLKVDISQMQLISAKGIFDPTLSNQISSKTLDGKQYFNYRDTELKVYTPIGLTAKTGLEKTTGLYTTNERTNGNLGYIGLEMPLLKGLLIDYQRAALKQAQIYISQSEQEKRKMLNDVYLEAIDQYWEWTASYQKLNLIEQNLQNSYKRLTFQRIAFQNGEKSANDTLEAHTQVQNVDLLFQDALMQTQVIAIGMAKYLWKAENTPYLLDTQTIPDMVSFATSTTEDQTEELINQAKKNHPELGIYKSKTENLMVEKKLKKQTMLPYLNLKMNVLSKSYYSFESVYSPFLTNNYKFGLDFKMPLFLREARGDFQKTIFKIQENNALIDNKQWEIETKIRAAGLELNALKKQINSSQTIVNNYKILLKNEELKLQQGESSLFLINSRENKLIEGLLKNQDLKLKYLKTSYKQLWIAGALVI